MPSIKERYRIIPNFNSVWIKNRFHNSINFSTVNCPKITAPKYGQVWVTGYGYSSIVYYRCNYGYDLHGSYSRKCQHDGTWYGNAPECRPVKRGQ